ncbi:MAG: ABC transporter ATP-binding protein [Fimbriimonadaceae bacterium]|nr:ABC transporter ATP-binding protein [Fimbriimonadaceae bacterium]QYK58446.1 MAG: ABC transporter ATP-binding protein [Fimbriimonadaceae bacterium]
MISLTGVSRWYGQVIGLNDVTCEIQPGVTALLGQNGAGKTTLMRLVTGQLRPTTGEVNVLGVDPFANPEVYRRMGYCPDSDSFPEHLSGREFVVRMARLAGFDASGARAEAEKRLVQVGMAERADRKLKGYSKGMRQRIKLAQAMVHDPDIILLDEPLNGLDPVGRRHFMDVLRALAAEGKTIIVSSHVLFEVEQMTRSIVLLHHGRLLASGDVSQIRALIDRHPHRVRIEATRPMDLAAWLVSTGVVSGAQVLGEDRLEVQTRNTDQFYSALPSAESECGSSIIGFDSPDNSMEAVYQYLVAR